MDPCHPFLLGDEQSRCTATIVYYKFSLVGNPDAALGVWVYKRDGEDRHGSYIPFVNSDAECSVWATRHPVLPGEFHSIEMTSA